MTLEIIMPHYNEEWNVVRPFFDMLSCQRGVDFDQVTVHIVHDGTDRFPASYFSHVPCKVRQSRIKHKGVSAARNYGIDKSGARWVTFCDCDDMYTSVYSLKFVMDVLDTEKHDMLWGDFIMENVNGGKLVLQENKKFNLVWIHNRYYRLEFLRENNLRFCEDLYMSEDSAFNAVLNTVIGNGRIAHINSPVPLYEWSYRPGSVTLDPSRLLLNMEGHFDRNLYVLEEFRKRNHPDADAMTVRTLTDAYVNLTRRNLPDGHERFEDRVREFIIREGKVMNSVDHETVRRILTVSENEAKGGGYLNPDRPELRAWIRSITHCKT